MSLYNTLVQDALSRKAIVPNKIITTYIADIESTELKQSDYPDSVSVAVLKKHKKGVEETLGLLDNGDTRRQDYELELKYLESLLPAAITGEEVVNAVKQLSTDNSKDLSKKNFGFFMKELRAIFSDRFDGNIAKNALNTLLD